MVTTSFRYKLCVLHCRCIGNMFIVGCEIRHDCCAIGDGSIHIVFLQKDEPSQAGVGMYSTILVPIVTKWSHICLSYTIYGFHSTDKMDDTNGDPKMSPSTFTGTNSTTFPEVN